MHLLFCYIAKNCITMKPFSQFFILLSASVCLAACNSTSSKDQNGADAVEPENKQISISCDRSFQKIMTAWVEDFNRSHPMISVVTLDSNADLHLISEDNITGSMDTGFWYVPVMRAGIIPVVSSRNPYLENLEQQGISKENLIRIFTADQINWGEVMGTDSRDPFVPYLPERGKGFNTRWAKFLDVSVESLQGKRYADRDTLIDAFIRNPYTIAVLGACCAYDPETNKIRDELVPLSVDLNNDGRIDKKERISNDLCEVQRNLYLGLHPSKLCNCIFLQAKELPLTEEQIVFIKWILTQGQHHVSDYGYSIMRHAAANKIIQELEAQLQ